MSNVLDRIEVAKAELLQAQLALEAMDPGDAEALADAFLALDDLRANCTVVKDFAESLVVTAMADLPEMEVGGAVLMKRRSDSRKAWDHKALVADLAGRLVQSSVDFETGEMTKSTEQLISEVIDYAGVSYWKVTALNKVGLVANEYCEVTEGSEKIRIQRNAQ